MRFDVELLDKVMLTFIFLHVVFFWVEISTRGFLHRVYCTEWIDIKILTGSIF